MLFICFFGIRSLAGHTGSHWWLGATNLGNEPNYYWFGIDTPLEFNKFEPGEPNNAGGTENCVQQLSILQFKAKWNDQPCRIRNHFICEDDII